MELPAIFDSSSEVSSDSVSTDEELRAQEMMLTPGEITEA